MLAVPVVPEGTTSNSAVIRQGNPRHECPQLLAEALGNTQKTAVSSAIDNNGVGYGV